MTHVGENVLELEVLALAVHDAPALLLQAVGAGELDHFDQKAFHCLVDEEFGLGGVVCFVFVVGWVVIVEIGLFNGAPTVCYELGYDFYQGVV